nr:unnamed protein product [Callosobruchus chinensis]
MNTYLHRWQISMDTTTVDDASQRTADVISLLDSLQDLLDTAKHENERKIDNYKWIRQLFRDQQQDSLNVATYRLLRNIEKNLHRIDIPTADYKFSDEHIKFNIWLRVILPIPLPNPRRPPKARLDINFENVNLQALFPLSIECEGMALRAMYVKYDHLSDLCSSFGTPDVPEEITRSLLDVTKQEWRTKLKYKFENRDIIPQAETTPEIPVEEPSSSEPDVPKQGESDKEHEEDKTTLEEKQEVEEDIPLVPYKKLTPTASEFAINREDEIYLGARKSYIRNIPEGALNLRKFSIIGGVFHLDLLYQPPQPQHYVTMDLNLTCLYIPKQLEKVPFMVSYTPPKPTEPGVRKQPEEIEEEMKRQEEELDKLICVTLTWPQHVIFLEPPIVCQWDPEKRHWMKDNIHDVKPNEEKCIISFRTGSFGVIGLATIRYSNLPYQAWELKPEEDGSVTLNITAAILMLEFKVKGGLICLSQLQNSPSNALQDLVGVYMKLFKLKRLMKEAGVDVFPEPDAFLYVEGSCEKHWPMEKHLYFCMARMCGCFNFAWSRWNLTAGRRNIVMQMRDYIPGSQKQKNHMMCLVTPLKATYINCTEVSPAFTDEDIENVKFNSDLVNLMKSTCGIAIRKKTLATSLELQYAVSQLLILTRVLSFS